ncbi:MULE transposase [Hirsutella rhossiliensis]
MISHLGIREQLALRKPEMIIAVAAAYGIPSRAKVKVLVLIDFIDGRAACHYRCICPQRPPAAVWPLHSSWISNNIKVPEPCLECSRQTFLSSLYKILHPDNIYGCPERAHPARGSATRSRQDFQRIARFGVTGIDLDVRRKAANARHQQAAGKPLCTANATPTVQSMELNRARALRNERTSLARGEKRPQTASPPHPPPLMAPFPLPTRNTHNTHNWPKITRDNHPPRNTTSPANQPPPPNNMPLFETFDDAFDELQRHARCQGYAIVKFKPSNYEHGLPRRYDIVCACGGREYKRTSCPFRVKVVRLKLEGDLWRISANRAGAFPEYRRLHPHQLQQVKDLSRDAGLTARQILLALRAKSPRLLATEQDIANICARLPLIARLDEEGAFHKELLDDEDRFFYQIVGLDPALRLWAQHSHLMMADIWPQAARDQWNHCLGLYLPVAFCLVPSEDTNAFTWCFIQLREWLQSKARLRGEADGNAFIPHVIITDYDAAARAALTATFPDSQLQVCTWHIMKNITTNAKKRWLGDYDDDDPFDPPQEPQDDEDPGRSAATGATAGKEALCLHNSLPVRSVCPDRGRVQQPLGHRQSAFSDQHIILRYVEEVWMPVRTQWARAWVCRYRNWGHTTTSPCESLHSSSRTFLRNGQSNLLELYHALQLQASTSREHHDRTVERESRRTRDLFRLPLYEEAVEKASYPSLELVQKQALAASAGLLKPQERPLGECGNSFTAQYGLPCKHIIASYLQVQGEGTSRKVIATRPLPLNLWDNHWLLRQDLAVTDPYRRIRDPRTSQSHSLRTCGHDCSRCNSRCNCTCGLVSSGSSYLTSFATQQRQPVLQTVLARLEAIGNYLGIGPAIASSVNTTSRHRDPSNAYTADLIPATADFPALRVCHPTYAAATSAFEYHEPPRPPPPSSLYPWVLDPSSTLTSVEGGFMPLPASQIKATQCGSRMSFFKFIMFNAKTLQSVTTFYSNWFLADSRCFYLIR